MVARHVITRDALTARSRSSGGGRLPGVRPMTGGLRERLYFGDRRVLALCAADLAHTDDTLPLPLSGAAYRLAQEAYAAYDAHRYAESIARTREAIRQRPDVVRLRLLLANAWRRAGI